MVKQRQIITLVKVIVAAAEYCEAMQEADIESIPYVMRWLREFGLDKNKNVMVIFEQIAASIDHSMWKHVVWLWLNLAAIVAVSECSDYKED